MLKAGEIYFALVFAVGCVLGPIRELWIVPHLGATAGALLEAPLMLLAMIVAARWVIRYFEIPYRLRARLAMGCLAFGLLLLAEVAGVLWLRRLSIDDYLATFRTSPGLISLLLFVLFAVMPVIVERSGRTALASRSSEGTR